LALIQCYYTTAFEYYYSLIEKYKFVWMSCFLHLFHEFEEQSSLNLELQNSLLKIEELLSSQSSPLQFESNFFFGVLELQKRSKFENMSCVWFVSCFHELENHTKNY
jgi:hypothetical protein